MTRIALKAADPIPTEKTPGVGGRFRDVAEAVVGFVLFTALLAVVYVLMFMLSVEVPR